LPLEGDLINKRSREHALACDSGIAVGSLLKKRALNPYKKSEGSPRWEAQLIKCFKVADTVRVFPDPHMILVGRMRHERGSAGETRGADVENPEPIDPGSLSCRSF
jgi:hypothetical protein